jgi:hypothetical protein
MAPRRRIHSDENVEDTESYGYEDDYYDEQPSPLVPQLQTMK